MGLHLKRVLACVTAASLMLVSMPEYPGVLVRQADAAERIVSAEQGVQEQGQTLDKKQKGAQEAATEESSSAVVFSKESGTYGEAFDLELSCSAEVVSGTAIYYTTDGSDPSDSTNKARKLYTSGGIHIADRKGDPNVLSAIDPILFDATNVKASSDGKSFESTVEKPSDQDVDKCTVIKAAVQYADGTCSEVLTNTYFIGEMADHIEGIRQSCEAAGMDLSVMSISMDANDLFDSTKGIYVKGDVFNQALEEYLTENGSISDWDAVNASRGMDANYKQKGKAWERKSHIDYFESNGTETNCKLQQDCGIRIQGNYSRSDYQKSFRLYARADYGEKNFKYGFWNQAKDDQGQVVEKYKKIVLRNGGNCAFTTKFSDAYWQSLMEGIDCDTQSARPCVVYLNGEYWGVYILQNDFCSDYFADKHGVDKDSVVVYKGDADANRVLGYKLDEGTLPEGVTNEDYYFEEIENFMKEHDDISNQADYEAFCQLVDKDSALDYFATQVWINNKWDWPGKNWSMWKTTNIDPNNPYADGKWRFLVYDVEFGGISGKDDSSANTVKDSKLLTTGTADHNDTNWDKPNVRCFALFMTNPEFREAFKARLTGFSDTMFERSLLLKRAEQFRNTYQPILDQFFNRFPTLWNGEKKTAEMAMNGNGWDTYGTLANIIAFAETRANNIGTITKWIDRKYPAATSTPVPTQVPTQAPNPTDKPGSSSAPQGVDKPIQITLCDGAKKIVQLDASGKVISTKYQVEGVTYLLKANKTLAYSADNNKSLKKKSSCVILDQVVAGGNLYKVTEVEAGALQNLKKLKSVTIGENVKTIGKNAFRGCKKLKKIIFLGKKVKSIGSKAFDGIAKKAKITCPKAKKKAYQKLVKKSGVNLKKTKIKVTALTMKGSTASGKAVNNQNTATSANSKAAENADKITMSSLQAADGSFQNATKGATVTIGSAEELRMLSEYTRLKRTTAGVTFVQTVEIDGTGIVMEPIGVDYYAKYNYGYDDWDIDVEEMPFKGTYDGGGYSVKNLTISIKKSEADYYNIAMFGDVEDAVLQNIELDSIAFVDAESGEPFTATENTVVRMGGIVASGSESRVIGCSNHADITAEGKTVYVAGIAAYAGTVSNCSNDGNITANTLVKTEEGVEYEADVSATGISYYPTSVDHCTNFGTIQSDGEACGIFQYIESEVFDCVNEGAITGKTSAAGIAISNEDQMRKCINYGTVNSDGTAAGIVAHLYGSIFSCENNGTITGGQYAGGIMGTCRYWGEAYAVKNKGDVNSEKIAGGIAASVGSRYGGSNIISNVQNIAAVYGQEVAGGIVGCVFNVTLGNVWNHGEISGASQVGGIVGSGDLKYFLDQEDEDISPDGINNIYFNCVNAGTVSGGTEMGTMTGHSFSGDQLSHCYVLEGEELPVSGTDSSLTAEKVSVETLVTQDFLDQFNQNMEEMQDIVCLPVSYDEGELQWKPRMFLELEIYSNNYWDGEVTVDEQLRDQFRIKNTETGETMSLHGENGLYYMDAEYGSSYAVHYYAANGTEKQLQSEFSVQEGEAVYVRHQNIRYFSFYTGAEQVEGYNYYKPTELAESYFYIDEDELNDLWPADPKREGYEFGGWYRTAEVTSPEWYEQTKQEKIEAFQESEELYHLWWEEDEDGLLDWYDSEEDYVKQNLIESYGTDSLEEYISNYDTFYDQIYKIENIQDGLWWEEDYLYAKWFVPGAVKDPQPTQTPQPSDPVKTPQPSSSPDVKQVDPSKYQDPAGDYVQKKGLIYKVNRKKKTATVVGVNSKSITKATIVAKVKTGGKTYKVSAISKNAFKGCSGLKKITAKGKSLKKVKKKALKMIRKKKK